MDRWLLWTIAAFFAVFTTGALSRGSEWAAVPDPVVYACKGKTVKLPWILNTDPGTDVEAVHWFFHGTFSQELVATLTHGEFLAGQKYVGRVSQHQNSGVLIRDVTPNDAGNYTVEVIMRKGNASAFVPLSHTVTVQASDDLMTAAGQVEVTQDPVALWDATSSTWLIRLLCGRFLFMGKPPIRVEWVTPTGATRESSGYEGGNFYLSLPPPLIPEGNYTCRIPRHFYTEVCVDGSGRRGGSATITEATIFVDEIRARLTLAEAELGRLDVENKQLTLDNRDLKDQLTNHSIQLRQVDQQSVSQSSLRQQLLDLSGQFQGMQRDVSRLTREVDGLRNVSEELGMCLDMNYEVLDDISRDVNNRAYNRICDQTLPQKWYRLYLNKQDAVLPTTCPPVNRCGTHATTWLDLQGMAIPAVGRELVARVCSHWDNNCCLKSEPVTVRNCKGFLLYKLGPITTGCSYGYCFQKAE